MVQTDSCGPENNNNQTARRGITGDFHPAAPDLLMGGKVVAGSFHPAGNKEARTRRRTAAGDYFLC